MPNNNRSGPAFLNAPMLDINELNAQKEREKQQQVLAQLERDRETQQLFSNL